MTKILKIPKGSSEAINQRKTIKAMAKNLKIPKGSSEAINQRKIVKTMAKSLKIPKGPSKAVILRKTGNARQNEQTIIYKVLHIKLKIKQHKPD